MFEKIYGDGIHDVTVALKNMIFSDGKQMKL